MLEESVNDESNSDVAVKIPPLVPLSDRPVDLAGGTVVAMSNTGHRGYLWNPPSPERRNGLGVGWLAEVDMRLLRLRVSFWQLLGRGDDIYMAPS